MFPCVLTLQVQRPKRSRTLLCRWADDNDDEEDGLSTQNQRSTKKQPPPQGKRKGWVPRDVDDFGDGGAFPEIHVAQFPLDMGRKDGTASKTVALQMDAAGNIKYDAILQQGRHHKTLIQGSARDLVARKVHEMDVDRPDEDEVMKKTQETQAALEKILNGKLTAAKVARPEINQVPPPPKCGVKLRVRGVSGAVPVQACACTSCPKMTTHVPAHSPHSMHAHTGRRRRSKHAKHTRAARNNLKP